MFTKVLVANRGEIACRVLRTLDRLGVAGVAVFSDADAEAKHVREAGERVRIGEAPAPVSYLNPAAIVEAALQTGAEAIHPGYGFLSENAMFARACAEAGITFIGPPPDVLELSGDKVAARKAFDASGFPVLPGGGPFDSAADAVAASADIGFPVMVKATSGGGGIGMGIANDEAELAKQVETASTRGERFFSDPTVYLERYVPSARHIEVQVLADDNRTIHLYERECSVQRRHQKVLEESPSPALTDPVRDRLLEAAVRSMESIGYRGAGTVECILTPDGDFFFLEVNARLQVEHPVTEMITGVDLVEEQLRIAAGEGMSMERAPDRHGHAVECRVYAEDPKTFLPAPGTIARMVLASDESRRFDFGYDEGDAVPMFYDPLMGKVIVHAASRAEAIAEMAGTLEATTIEGLRTNVPALVDVLRDERFVSGSYDTGLLGR